MFIARRRTADLGRIPKGAGQVLAALLGVIGLFAITLIVFGAGRAGAQVPEPKAAQKKSLPKATSESPPPPPTGSGTVRPVGPLRRFAKGGLLDLEDAVARAELIIAVRLVDMTEAKIVYGGKTEVVTQQFKFEPVRTLKGIFAREALLMTGQDLNIYQYGDAADRLGRGQLLLVLLGRSGQGYFNCNTAWPTLEQSIPRLRDQDDPLLATVQVLIAVTQQRDRAQKVELLLDGLRQVKGRPAIPLLMALRRRAVLAAQAPGALDAVTRSLGGAPPEVNEAVARALQAILEADYLDRRELRAAAAAQLLALLHDVGPDLDARVAALDALGALGQAARGNEEALAWLRADRESPTFAERAARLRALGRVGVVDQTGAVLAFLDALPLDAPPAAQEEAGRALGRLDPTAAARSLAARLGRKAEAGFGIAIEIALLGELPPAVAAPALLEASQRPLDLEERLALAHSSVRVADPRLVPALGGLLDPRQPALRYQAIEALRRIDTDEAASVLWLHLGEEGDLLRKLQLAEFLGRHGFRGGYPYAIEHMSEPTLRDQAVEALAAIREPKAIAELRRIWESSHDRAWNAAAIRALGRLGQAEIAPRLLEITQDLRDPLAAPALIALGDLGEDRALPILREGLASRNEEVVVAAARAAGTLLTRPGARGDEVRDRLAALLADPYAAPNVRSEALDVLVALDDPRLGTVLAAAARDAGLEGNDLLRRVEERLAARKERLAWK
jgi:HEAT repeat protein